MNPPPSSRRGLGLGGGRRRVIPITGGSLTGPGLAGEVLPGGRRLADPQARRRHPAAGPLHRADDRRATIGIINTGVRRADDEVVRRLTAGEDVYPSLYYFRVKPIFEADAEPAATPSYSR